jgi:hypothetical protein
MLEILKPGVMMSNRRPVDLGNGITTLVLPPLRGLGLIVRPVFPTEEQMAKEREATVQACKDLIGLLSHDTSLTRFSLAALLRTNADKIQLEAKTDQALEDAIDTANRRV